jgi:hypothetical protein
MALKKKGTPAKIEVVVKTADLERFKELVNDTFTSDIITIKEDKKNKNKS